MTCGVEAAWYAKACRAVLLYVRYLPLHQMCDDTHPGHPLSFASRRLTCIVASLILLFHVAMAAIFERKIFTRDALAQLRPSLPGPVVFTNGVFDILHRGHVSYLADAKALGACLIVGVNSDASVRMLGKGDDRPINHEDDRMALLAALESVDYVVQFVEQTPVELISALRPDVLVKGGDYEMDRLPESALVRSWGGRALAIPFEHDRSTSKLLKKVRAQD